MIFVLNDARSRLAVGGQLEHLYEVGARAMRHDRQSCSIRNQFVLFEESIDDFINRAIAAHGDDGIRTLRQRLCSDTRRVPRSLSSNCFDGTLQMRSYLRPCLKGFTMTCCRIDYGGYGRGQICYSYRSA